jgi:phosphate transport system substrate-binding protein
MRFPKSFAASAVFALASVAVLGADHITLIGSDTMVKLGQHWAESFMKSHAGAVMQVSGGGSSSGIAALLNGSTNICQASRAMDSTEIRLAEERSIKPIRITVALDGIAVYVNKNNHVDSLSLSQLKNIYRGVFTNWNQAGGPDHRIILYSRENSSGTYTFFKEHVLNREDFAPETEDLAGTSAVIHAILNDPYGIGFGGVAYHEGVKCVALKNYDSSVAVVPTAQTIADRTYPLARELYWYVSGAPTNELKSFIDWVLSAEGQKMAEQNGFVRLPAGAAGNGGVK